MLTKEQKEMAREYQRIDFPDRALVNALLALLKTPEQQQQMVDYMRSQENLTYAGVADMIHRIRGDKYAD